jgi:hypothetical protein
VDCGGDSGCPRCAAGRACQKTLDCLGDASNATLALFARYNYTGQAFICSAASASASSGNANANSNSAAGVCTDARLSLSVYGVNTTEVPRFVQFKLSLGGLPAKAPISAVLEFIRSAVFSSINQTSSALAALLSMEDVIVAGATPPVVAPSPTPSSSPLAGASASRSASATISTSPTSSAVGASPNITSSPTNSPSATTSPIACINGTQNGTVTNCTTGSSSSGSSNITCINGTYTDINGTVKNCSSSSTSSSGTNQTFTCINGTYTDSNGTVFNCSSSASSDNNQTFTCINGTYTDSNGTVFNCSSSSASSDNNQTFTCVNGTYTDSNGTVFNCSSSASSDNNQTFTCVNGTYTDSNGTVFNCSSIASNSTNGTRRMLASDQELEMLAKAYPSLTLPATRNLRSMLRRLAATFSMALDIKVILPVGVNTTTALQTLGANPASFSSSIATAVSSSLVAANYTTDPIALSVDLLPASGNTTSGGNSTANVFSIAAPIAPIVEKVGVTPVAPVAPVAPADAGSGGGAGAGAAAAIIILLVLFFGVAFYFVRSSGSFLGCTFGPLADCFGKWPLTPTAQANRAAVQSKGLWSSLGPRKVISSSPADPTAQAVDMGFANDMQKQNVLVNPLATVQQQANMMMMQQQTSHMNLNMQMQGNNNNNNTNRMEFSPMGMGGMPNQRLNPMAAAAAAAAASNNINSSGPVFGNPLMAAMNATQLSAQYGSDAMVVHQSACRIQAVYRGYRVRKMTATERLAARAGKAALKATDAASAQAAAAVSKAASSLARAESALGSAQVASGMRRGPMSDLEAALLVQRVYKGCKLRQALKGWVKVVDDDGDVFYKNEATGALEWLLPSMPFGPAEEEGEGEEGGEAEQEGELDYEVDEDGNTWYLDGPGGPRLAWGWRRCEDGEDVWYVNDEDPDVGSSWEPIYADQ